jgi:hypothetical protein
MDFFLPVRGIEDNTANRAALFHLLFRENLRAALSRYSRFTSVRIGFFIDNPVAVRKRAVVAGAIDLSGHASIDVYGFRQRLLFLSGVK